MRYVSVLVLSGTISLVGALIGLPDFVNGLAIDIQPHDESEKPVRKSRTVSSLSRRNLRQKKLEGCEGPLQKRGQCLGKTPRDQSQRPARSQRQSRLGTGQNLATNSPLDQRTPPNSPINSPSQRGSVSVGGTTARQHPGTSVTDSPYMPLSNSLISKGRPTSSSPDSARSSQSTMRHNLLNTGATGVSTMTQTELDSVSSGRLSVGQTNHPPRAPTTKVKIRGPGIIEVDNLQGHPRSTILEIGERGHDGMRNPGGVSSLAYTEPGGKSRSRAKGEVVTAKVHKHGIGMARVRVKDSRGTTEETIDHGTFGTRTFAASSDDPGNPASIKVKASGSIYASLFAQNKPVG